MKIQGLTFIRCRCILLCKYMQIRTPGLTPFLHTRQCARHTACPSLHMKSSHSFLNSCTAFHCLSTRVDSAFELCPIFCYFVDTQVLICGINSRNEISVPKGMSICNFDKYHQMDSLEVVPFYIPTSSFFQLMFWGIGGMLLHL